MRPRSLGLVVNGVRPGARLAASEIARRAEAHAIAVFATGEGDAMDLPAWGDQHVDVVVAVGGDGTVLQAARRSVELDVPMIGINLGTIGFLADAEPEEVATVVDMLAGGEYEIEERNTLRAVLPDGRSGIGVNDVVVEKIDAERLVILAVEIDGEPFLTYRADGVVVATSTGSTAYSFSAGGPLLDPKVPAILITPVAPHSLFDRTLIVPALSRVAVTVAADRPVRVGIDGRELGSLEEGETVHVEPGPVPAKFIRFRDEGFPGRVTRKFDVG
ncbi:MAG TPA: NAD(+)/NADH kinase [Acidimicrobiia bacterium]